jgi:uncharacterized membrane protein
MLENLIGSDFPPQVLVFIISALPIVELRGAIPLAINVFNLPWYEALSLSVLGNMLPVPFLLLFFESLLKLINRTEGGRKFSGWLLKMTGERAKKVERYERIGLMLFVAIPLPWTGAWTGSIIAFLLGIKFSRALLSIACGVVIAGAIVVCLSLLGWVGAVIAGVALSALAVLGLLKM